MSPKLLVRKEEGGKSRGQRYSPNTRLASKYTVTLRTEGVKVLSEQHLTDAATVSLFSLAASRWPDLISWDRSNELCPPNRETIYCTI